MADDDDLYDEDDADDSLAVDEDKDVDEDDSPFSEPSDTNRKLPLDHPQFDGDIDSHELYDEGLDGAVEIDLPGTHIE